MSIRDRDGAFGEGGAAAPEGRLTWTWADNDANDAQARDVEVDRAVATQYAARARQEAVQRNGHGDYVGARAILEATAKRIRSYAGSDPRMRELVSELRAEAEQFAAPMSPLMLKEAHFASSSMARMRSMSGQALRQRG